MYYWVEESFFHLAQAEQKIGFDSWGILSQFLEHALY